MGRFAQLALFERDKALKQVADNAGSWMELALARIPSFPDRHATGEDIRLYIEREVGSPHHHNAYGALIATAKRRGHLRPTGQFVAMKTRKSHARKTELYTVGR